MSRKAWIKSDRPGLLCGDLTIEKITTKMVSERRNELIADLFHRVHFIEKWGRGIRLILSREPGTKFEEVGTHFIVTFRRKGVPASVVQEGREKTVEKIRSLIRQNPKLTRKELSKERLLRRVGPDKGGYWVSAPKSASRFSSFR